ncbi:putative membrane protein YdjX (TVP38/TMEM64 family) [Salirhabdus euzebyi]|uniref:Putative membrane protein YdjX (TVP38/TMEM64 family) n=1 Tax=Salirhabdus euzebyi TaxID=394506 RepID=A0A841Q8A0_9BACI|nr:VTT domain-containing protein [Salirhabdus euzebyi]MBB6454626.1 putative membrane protein YdjX (TVP38/TMEM64 family) [Salirhabdus euzebyi]
MGLRSIAKIEKQSFTKGIIFQLVLLISALYLLYEGMPSLLPLYRNIGFFLSVTIFTIWITAQLLGRKEFIKVIKLTSICYGIILFLTCVIYYVSSFIVLVEDFGIESILGENEVFAKITYFAICFIQPILLPIPEAVTVVAASSVMGALSAFLLGFTGTLLGIFTMFMVSRIGGMKFVEKFVKPAKIEQYHKYVEKNEVFILVLLFIIPILPDEIICIGAGVSGVSIKRFLIIATLSKLVTSFTFAYSVELASMISLTATEIITTISIGIFIVISLSFFVKRLLLK